MVTRDRVVCLITTLAATAMLSALMFVGWSVNLLSTSNAHLERSRTTDQQTIRSLTEELNRLRLTGYSRTASYSSVFTCGNLDNK